MDLIEKNRHIADGKKNKNIFDTETTEYTEKNSVLLYAYGV